MKVLVVDDEALVRRSLKRAFVSKGHEVIEAVDGQEGVDFWRKEAPDVIFLDILMPKLSGPQVLRELGKERSGEVILMSAYSGEDNDKMARQLGAQSFVAKPFEDIFSLVEIAEQIYGKTRKE